MSLQKPNYTQIPNILLDDTMSKLTGSETKVLMCLCRKIFGWHKENDKVSISQIMIMTGLGKTQIIKALKTLENMNIVKSLKTFGKTTEYTLIIEESEPVQKVNNTSSESEQVKAKTGSESEHTKESIKETKQKKHKYGEFNNVMLTDTEYKKLHELFNNKFEVDFWIKELDEGIELKGYKYSSHYLAIRNWYNRRIKEKKKQSVYADLN